MKNVTVFCGSHPRGENGEVYRKLAVEMGKLFAENDFTCVNGGTTGLMEDVSRGTIEADGEVISIALHNKDFPIANKYFTEQELFEELVPRQQRLIELGDVYLALPGGIGTFYEILEIVSRVGLREIDCKFPVICVGGYFKKFKELIRHIDHEGFAWMDLDASLLFVESPKDAIVELKRMRDFA
ncbi:TIGR00730 family Rossman fold protein [Candidatus Uhrbacteria bacterium]|jgi:uncharacterized protein (TIGR00730 family)|nr:TIGR00730 family Rossman fold protein [Candidatus Uhrbacteria bacterium]